VHIKRPVNKCTSVNNLRWQPTGLPPTTHPFGRYTRLMRRSGIDIAIGFARGMIPGAWRIILAREFAEHCALHGLGFTRLTLFVINRFNPNPFPKRHLDRVILLSLCRPPYPRVVVNGCIRLNGPLHVAMRILTRGSPIARAGRPARLLIEPGVVITAGATSRG
jgi:hypothetical protein